MKTKNIMTTIEIWDVGYGISAELDGAKLTIKDGGTPADEILAGLRTSVGPN